MENAIFYLLAQLLPSERKNFCCNPVLRYLIPPLRPLPLSLYNLYISNSQENFSHLSHQYNSLFLFTTLGYTGGVVHLQHPHTFAINSQAYYQIHSTNMTGNPLDKDSVNLIEQELATINPFVQAQSFKDLQTVNGNLYSTFQDATHALGLLENITEYEQCFNKAMSYNCAPGQLCLLFCWLIIEGIAAQTIWQNHHELLSTDYIAKKRNTQERENEALMWITNFLEEHGIKITQTGLPQPSNYLSEIIRIKTQ
ncbi:9383_t:CDS:2 [Dentiscutata heterogama]|uniref:9383_t:CDS:1 n=1 Tax=Dentiscutata heterogama TaxID=1316150 RepID=A0ACA9K6C7_9GLOM|nr:9383_t:CDS:2 [Dentiscutata heterogama]